MSPTNERKPNRAVAYRSGMRVAIAALAGTSSAERARQALMRAKRIAVLNKFKFMGDTLVATPLLRQLRQYCPEAEIDIFTSSSAATALEDYPYINRAISLKQGSGRRLQHMQELVHTLKKGHYDVAFLLNRSMQCAIATKLAGIPTRIGYKAECRSPLLTLPIPYSFDRNEISCHLDMLRALGLPAEDTLPELVFSDTIRARTYELLTEFGWRGDLNGHPLIGFQPGANDAYIREWGADRYARVADRLIEELGATVVILGGLEEKETADEMERIMTHPALNLIGKTKLREALALIGNCDLWIGNDSGLLHTAVAQGVPTIGIYGPNKVVRWGYDTKRHRSLVVFPERPAETDAAIRQCLDQIPITLVLKTAREVMNATPTAFSEAEAPYFTATQEQAQLLAARRR